MQYVLKNFYFTDKLKSMYMNEMGRLYNHFGNVSCASWCFRQAADFFKTGGDKEIFNADVQALTLIANAHDQGYLKLSLSVV